MRLHSGLTQLQSCRREDDDCAPDRNSDARPPCSRRSDLGTLNDAGNPRAHTLSVMFRDSEPAETPIHLRGPLSQHLKRAATIRAGVNVRARTAFERPPERVIFQSLAIPSTIHHE
jgi:hypothetical protein